MSYLNYLSFEITLLMSSAFFMIGKMVDVVYGIFLTRKKMEENEGVALAIKSLANAWMTKMLFEEGEKQENKNVD